MQNIPTRRLVILVVAVLMLALVAYFGFIAVNRNGKTAVSLSAFPGDMSISINDQPVETGTIYLSPGTYQLEAEQEGYDSYSKTLVLEDIDQTVAIILTPESDEAFEYGRNNENEYLKVQAEGEKAAAEAGKIFNDLNPITKDLPYKTFFYSVGYRMDQSDPSGNSIIIEIDAAEPYRQTAIYRIRQLGYDPTDFIINFRDYENPFPL